MVLLNNGISPNAHTDREWRMEGESESKIKSTETKRWAWSHEKERRQNRLIHVSFSFECMHKVSRRILAKCSCELQQISVQLISRCARYSILHSGFLNKTWTFQIGFVLNFRIVHTLALALALFIFVSFFLRIFLNEKTNWQIIILLIMYLLSSSPNIETLLTFIAEKVCAIMRMPLQMNTEKKS